MNMLEAIRGRETAAKVVDQLIVELPQDIGVRATLWRLSRKAEYHDAQDAAMLKVVEAAASVGKYRKALAVAALSCPLMSVGEAADATASLRVLVDALAPLVREEGKDG